MMGVGWDGWDVRRGERGVRSTRGIGDGEGLLVSSILMRLTCGASGAL